MQQTCIVSTRPATIRPRREIEKPSMYFNSSNDATDGPGKNQNGRIAALPDAGATIAESAHSFVANTHQQCDDPVIARFRAALMSIQTKELDRLYHRLPKLDERSRQEIGQFADCLVATILRPPLESLREESHNNSAHGLLDALQRLFQLAD